MIRARGFPPLAALLLAGCVAIQDRGREPRIVFTSDRSGNDDLYIARLDGTEVRRLTSDPQSERLARCSPDRRRIAFVRGEGPAAEIVVLDLTTGAEHALTQDGVRDSTPEWSPDGRHLYFTRRDGKHDRIAVIPVEGGEPRFLTPPGVHNVMPGASPDGRSLVHHSYAYGSQTELQLLDIATGRLSRLTDAPGSDFEATFAGSGRLVFSSNRAGGHYRLYELAIGDTEPRLIADTGADSWGARWNRGELLSYTGKPGSWRLMRSRQGYTPRAVLDDGRSNSMPDWC